MYILKSHYLLKLKAILGVIKLALFTDIIHYTTLKTCKLEINKFRKKINVIPSPLRKKEPVQNVFLEDT